MIQLDELSGRPLRLMCLHRRIWFKPESLLTKGAFLNARLSGFAKGAPMEGRASCESPQDFYALSNHLHVSFLRVGQFDGSNSEFTGFSVIVE